MKSTGFTLGGLFLTLVLAVAAILFVWFVMIVKAEPLPAACTGTYGAPITADLNAKRVTGTTGNDLIYVSGNSNSVNSLGGDDCIVITGKSNKVLAGSGNDVVVDSGKFNSVLGESGLDYLSVGSYAKADGGADIDTCSGGLNSKLVNCEL